MSAVWKVVPVAGDGGRLDRLCHAGAAAPTEQEAGRPRIGPHGLRYSAATWLITSGASPKLVRQRIAHASPTVTLSLYSHVLPGHDEAAGVFAAALADAVTAQSGRECDHDVTTDAT